MLLLLFLILPISSTSPHPPPPPDRYSEGASERYGKDSSGRDLRLLYSKVGILHYKVKKLENSENFVKELIAETN